MNIQIKIRSKDLPMFFLIEQEGSPPWAEINIPPINSQRGIISEPWAIALITIVSSVPAAVIAGWILEKIKDKKSTTITINRKQVDLNEGKIIRVIEETTKIQN